MSLDSTIVDELRRKNNYTRELVYAVKYLMDKGFSTGEISKRLDISPFTVRNVKHIIRKASEKKAEKPAEKPKPKPSRGEVIKALRKAIREKEEKKK